MRSYRALRDFHNINEGSFQPLISVVIPTYNRANLVIKTLNSVIDQTYKNFEVIVVDNCSTDNTTAIIQKYLRTGKVIYIRHEENLERAASRNTGMKNAKGDFLTFLDSDDIAYPHCLENAKQFIQKHPEINIFHNKYVLTDEQGGILYRYPFPKPQHAQKAIAHGNFLSCIGVFIAREIYQNYRFDVDPEIVGTEDWEFWLRILATYKLGQVDHIDNAIIEHEGRTVNNIDINNVLKKQLEVIHKISSNPQTLQVYEKYLNRMRASGYVYTGIVATSFREFTHAFKLLLGAIKHDWTIVFTFRFLRVLQNCVKGFLAERLV